MSINSYFHSRKSRNTNVPKQVGAANTFAAQAPQPIYENLTKPTIIQKPKQTYCKNSILYYMSPTNKSSAMKIVKETAKETVIDVTTIDELPCRIRKKIPILTIWKDILEEFDPESLTNQLVSYLPLMKKEEPVIKKEENSVYSYIKDKESVTRDVTALDEPCQIRRKLEISTVWKDILEEFDPECQLVQEHPSITNEFSIENNAYTDRKRKFQNKEDGTRNVRIRTCLNPDIINQSMLLEDYVEDIQEDLSRPLRTKLTLEQTNNVLLEMADEVFMLTDNRWLFDSCLY